MNNINLNVWRALSGPSFQIPTVGSIVYYYPRLHDRACQGNNGNDDGVALVLPARLTARVTSLRLRANTGDGQDVFAEFGLQPVDDETPAAGEWMGGIEPDTHIFTKSMSNEDSRSSTCIVPRMIAEAIFPALQPDEAFRSVTVHDVGGRRWTLKYSVHTNSRNHRTHKLSGKWKDFIVGRGLTGGTDMVFIRRERNLTLGFKRGSRPPTQEARNAAANFNGRGRVIVNCYPMAGEEYIILKGAVDAVDGTPWVDGTRVRMGTEEGIVLEVGQDEYGLLLTVRCGQQTSRVRPWKLTPI